MQISRLVCVFAVLFAAACTTNPASLEANDPFEPTNRRVHAFNEAVDEAVLGPVARGYTRVTPEPARSSVRNVFINLNRPVVFANTVLQGNLNASADVVGSFALDTIFGLGGIVAVAEKQGVPQHTEDFGQTLAVWGVPEGPFIVLPLLGPSNPRDTVGRFADRYPHPFNYNQDFSQSTEAWAARGLNGLQWRADAETALQTLDRTAIDPYVQFRSAYRQSRASQIANGETLEDSVEDLPEFE